MHVCMFLPVFPTYGEFPKWRFRAISLRFIDLGDFADLELLWLVLASSRKHLTVSWVPLEAVLGTSWGLAGQTWKRATRRSKR